MRSPTTKVLAVEIAAIFWDRDKCHFGLVCNQYIVYIQRNGRVTRRELCEICSVAV